MRKILWTSSGCVLVVAMVVGAGPSAAVPTTTGHGGPGHDRVGLETGRGPALGRTGGLRPGAHGHRVKRSGPPIQGGMYPPSFWDSAGESWRLQRLTVGTQDAESEDPNIPTALPDDTLLDQIIRNAALSPEARRRLVDDRPLRNAVGAFLRAAQRDYPDYAQAHVWEGTPTARMLLRYPLIADTRWVWRGGARIEPDSGRIRDLPTGFYVRWNRDMYLADGVRRNRNQRSREIVVRLASHNGVPTRDRSFNRRIPEALYYTSNYSQNSPLWHEVPEDIWGPLFEEFRSRLGVLPPP